MAEADLSRIISVIMENPTLIEEIRKTLSDSESKSKKAEPEESEGEKAVEKSGGKEETESAAKVTSPRPTGAKSRRNSLLLAMRPYLSEERGRAIETMISVADVLFAIKEK